MIKVENIDVWGFEHAIKNIKAKGYRKTKTGYETFISNNGKSVSLGTFKKEDDAKNALLNYRVKRFVNKCAEMGLNPDNGVEYKNNYVVFPSGEILNLQGKEMIGHINRDGYREVIINGNQERVHRIIATIFLDNPNGLEQVNHKNGIKHDNNANNLEWCTRSENLIHAYKNGLEKKKCGENHHSHKLTEEDVRYIRKSYKKRDKNFGAVPLSQKFGVDRTTILDIVSGKTWRHVI